MPLSLFSNARSTQSGFTIIELLMVLAILAVMAAVGMPALNAALGMEQQSAVKEMGQTLTWLQEEAAMRNVAFRMEINLDRGTWKVTQGDPSSLIFATPEAAEEFRDAQKDQMKRFTKRQIAEGEVEVMEEPDKFNELDDPVFTSAQTLPQGIGFAFVYTPQYGEDGVVPNEELPDEPEEEAVAYVHVFPDGTAEHTVIRVIELNDPEEGYTLEMEPMGGGIRLTDELVDPKDSLDWIPEEGPDFR